MRADTGNAPRDSEMAGRSEERSVMIWHNDNDSWQIGTGGCPEHVSKW
jgi:hypothetical protein